MQHVENKQNSLYGQRMQPSVFVGFENIQYLLKGKCKSYNSSSWEREVVKFYANEHHGAFVP